MRASRSSRCRPRRMGSSSELIASRADGDIAAAELAGRFLGLRTHKDVGPAIFMDIASFLRERRSMGPASDQQLLFEAFYSYLLPQFEGVDPVEGRLLYRAVIRVVGARDIRNGFERP